MNKIFATLLVLVAFSVQAQTFADRVTIANQPSAQQQLVNDLWGALQQAQASLATAQQQLAAVTAAATGTQLQIVALQQQVATLQTTVSGLTAQLSAAQQQATVDAVTISGLRTQVAALQAQVASFSCPAPQPCTTCASPMVCMLPPPVVVPPPPLPANTASLIWDVTPNATGYRVYSGTASGAYQPLGTGTLVTTNAFTFASLAPGFRYFFAVTAIYSTVESGFSNEVFKDIGLAADTTAPSAPTGLTGAAAGSTGANLAWSASTDNVGVTGYSVRRNGVQIATPATTSFADTGLSAATTYSYTVAARDAAGNISPNSTSVSITTSSSPPGPVESPNLTKVTLPGVGSITDAKLVVWTLAPKDPLVEGGVEFVILHNGTREGGAATYLCYFNHLVYARSVGNWYQQVGLGFQFSPIVPTGC